MTELLRLDSVTKHFGGVLALDHIDLAVSDGEIVGLIGPNGAGKTTLFNVITNVFPIDWGSIKFRDEELSGLRPNRVVRRGMARTFQNIRLFASMSVSQHLSLARTAVRSGALRSRWTSSDGGVGEILDLTGLSDVRDELAITLPYGLQRRVEIARALALDPLLLLLDEPAAGMNPSETDDLRTLISEIRRRGVTILLIEHDMSFVMALCETIFVLNFGAVIAEGPPDKVQNDAVVLEAYLGQEEGS